MSSNNINLTDYILERVYGKGDSYTRSEIQEMVANHISNFEFVEIVLELPTENIKSNKLYLLINTLSIKNNRFDFYLYVNNKWERLDGLEFNIEDYPTSEEVDTLLLDKESLL